MLPALQVPCSNAEHGKRRRQVKAGNRMHQPVRKRRIEDDCKPAFRKKASVGEHVALRRLHPAIERENPERREQRPQRDHQRGEEMRPWRNELAAKQEDAEKARLEKERDHAFVCEQRAEDIRAALGKPAPVGAELKRHHDARHDAHAERHGEDARPEHRQPQIDRIALDEVQPLEQHDEGGESDGERREQDVERDHERELHARQEDRIQFH